MTMINTIPIMKVAALAKTRRVSEPRHASTYRGAKRNLHREVANVRGTDKKEARKARKAANGQ